MKRSLQVFMTPLDERAFSDRLKARYPKMRIFDDNIWSADGPVVVESIDLAASRYVYLFPSELFPELPTRARGDGKIVGPSSGCVVQVTRCSVDDAHLLSGAIGTGWDDGHPIYGRMQTFWKDLALVVKSLALNKLVRLFPESREVGGTAKGYWCFSHAVQWVNADPRRVLRDRAASALFRVESSPRGFGS